MDLEQLKKDTKEILVDVLFIWQYKDVSILIVP